MNTLGQSCAGILVGTAIGDSLGLPAEGLSRSRIQALWHGEWKHRFLFGWGMVSDDTEHSALTALCLMSSGKDAAAFQRALSWKLRLWFACLPPGVGLATARACIKMWLGFGSRSGVFSAGNGPAMRAAIIGAVLSEDALRRREFVTASTCLTHTDPKANWAALAVAECSAMEAQQAFSVADARRRLSAISAKVEWLDLVERIFRQLEAGVSVDEFAGSLGLRDGVSGYSLHSIPVAIFAWLRHRPDLERALVAALDCGGDTDSVAAIVGALGGSALGPDKLPRKWITPIHDWPWGVTRLRKIGTSLGDPSGKAPWLAWPLILLRNLAVLLVVLGHGFRRLLPPYGPRSKPGLR